MEKLYYTINEIAELLNEATHTIRYWEQQFPFLKSKKTKTGAKLYTKEQFNKMQYLHQEIHKNDMAVAGLKKKIKKNIKINDDQIILNKEEFKEMLGLLRTMSEVLIQEED